MEALVVRNDEAVGSIPASEFLPSTVVPNSRMNVLTVEVRADISNSSNMNYATAHAARTQSCRSINLGCRQSSNRGSHR
jgi:hypothetical protein